MKDAPKSYRDPFWIEAARKAEQKVGIPDGLLQSILLDGEKTNADQVSVDGARTPFQIIPETRKAYLDKTGVDAYLNPNTAAEVAALHLKDSLDGSGGNTGIAITEYFAGPDRSKWGPKSKAYHERVSSGFRHRQAQLMEAGTARAYAAYQSGEMDPEASAEFEADVQSGLLTLPKGASLKPTQVEGQAPQGGIEIPSALLADYQAGKLSPDARSEFEADVQSGFLKAPDGFQLLPVGPPETTVEGVSGAITRGLAPYAAGAAAGAALGAPLMGVGAIPGALGGAAAVGLTKLAGDPLLNAVNSMFGTNFMTPTEASEALLTKIGVAQPRTEAERIVQATTEAGASGLGTVGLGQSLMQGASPVTQAVGRTLAASPGAEVVSSALSGGASQAAQEAGLPLPLQMAAGLGGAITGGVAMTPGLVRSAGEGIVNLAGAVPRALQSLEKTPMQRALGEIPTGALSLADELAPIQASGVPTAAQLAPIDDLTLGELGRQTRAAGRSVLGKEKAIKRIVESTGVSQETVEAGQRLGIEEYLQPAHLTSSQAFREISEAVSSMPGSVSRQAENQGIVAIGQKAESLIEELGGVADLSTLSSQVKNRLDDSISELTEKAGELYGQVEKAIPKTSRAPATNTVSYIRGELDALGGDMSSLSSMQRKVLRELESVDGQNPTYALLDKVRKDVGEGYRGRGAFKDASSRELDALYSSLAKDQRDVATSFGVGETYDLANATTRMYKGVQDDAMSLFGKNLDETIVSKLITASGQVSKGDTARMAKLMQAVPADMRQPVMASVIRNAFGREIEGKRLNANTFDQFMSGLIRNQQAYDLVFSNLPKESRQQLKDLHVVSKAIAKATRERISTGRLQAAKEELTNADNLRSNIVKTLGKAAFGGAVGSVIGQPGVGVTVALAQARKTPMEQADKLFASPEFKKLMLEAAKNPAKKVAKAAKKTKVK